MTPQEQRAEIEYGWPVGYGRVPTTISFDVWHSHGIEGYSMDRLTIDTSNIHNRAELDQAIRREFDRQGTGTHLVEIDYGGNDYSQQFHDSLPDGNPSNLSATYEQP